MANWFHLLEFHIENDSEAVSKLGGKENLDRLVMSATGAELGVVGCMPAIARLDTFRGIPQL